MGWLSFLYRCDGRIRGGQFLVGLFGASLLGGLGSFVLVATLLDPDPARGLYRSDAEFWRVFMVGQIPGIVATAALIARRLHDVGKSAILAIPFFAYIAALSLAALGWPNINNTWLSAVLQLPIFAMLIWLFIAPGDPGDNRFGPAPNL